MWRGRRQIVTGGEHVDAVERKGVGRRPRGREVGREGPALQGLE